MSEPLFQPPQTPAPSMPAGFRESPGAENAVTREVQKGETVQGQMESLFKADNNPVLEQARQSGVRQTAKRGLQNTSFGVQAGEQSYISKAADIANADAAANQKAASENLQAVNSSNLQRLQTTGRISEATKQGEIQSGLSKQQFEQSRDLSSQGFDQALKLSEKDYQEQLGELAAQLANSKAMSELDQNELITQIQTENQMALQQIAERARFDAIQSSMDDVEARNFEALRAQLEEARALSASDIRRDEMEAEVLNKIREIEASRSAQLDVNREQDARRLQLTYLQESGAFVRQAMQDIGSVSSAQGLSVTQQQGAVSDIRRQLQNDLNLLQALYARSPDWDPDWASPEPGSGGGGTGYAPPPQVPFQPSDPTNGLIAGQLTPGAEVEGPNGPITLPYTPIFGRPQGNG